MLRSLLFVPGNRPDRFAKALAAGADAVIIDLEDAVPLAEKENARSEVETWLGAFSGSVMIRINGPRTQWFRDDVALCTKRGITGVVLPKTEDIEDILGLSELVHLPILPLIETAKGFSNASEIANTPGVQRLLFGSLDLQLDLGMSADNDELVYFRSTLVLISRGAGLRKPIDGVTTTINDPLELHNDAMLAKRLGFGGKLCIHPKQIETINLCFGPSAEEEAWARRVIEAVTNSGGAAIALDGKMVDGPVIARAEDVLKRLKHE